MKLLREILKNQPYDFLNHTKTTFDHSSHAELHKSLKKHYNGVKSLAAKEYQDGGSSTMNETLWRIHNNKAQKYVSQHVATHAPELQKTLLSQKTPHDLHVWSGTPIDPRQIKDKDNVVHHPAFLSTSLREGVAVNFARKRAKPYSSKGNDDTIYKNHLLKIHVPEGHPGLYMGNHDPSNFGKNEKEFILPAGTNLKHIKTETFNHDSMEGYSFGRHVFHVFHVHHMEVMPHKNKKFPIAEPTSKDT